MRFSNILFSSYLDDDTIWNVVKKIKAESYVNSTCVKFDGGWDEGWGSYSFEYENTPIDSSSESIDAKVMARLRMVKNINFF